MYASGKEEPEQLNMESKDDSFAFSPVREKQIYDGSEIPRQHLHEEIKNAER